MNRVNLKIVEFNKLKKSSSIKSFFNRSIIETNALRVAERIINDVKINGDIALFKSILKYDNVNLNSKTIKISESDIQSAIKSVDKYFKNAVNYAIKNITESIKIGLSK